MTTLRETAMVFKSGKDITDLKSIPVDMDLKTATYEKNGQKFEYTYFELDGWKYTIKAGLMNKIKQMLSVRPTTKNIKVGKDEKGEYFVIPLD